MYTFANFAITIFFRNENIEYSIQRAALPNINGVYDTSTKSDNGTALKHLPKSV